MCYYQLLPGSKSYLFVVITEEEAASLFHDIIRPIHIIQSLPHPSLAPLGLLAHIQVHQQTRYFQPACPFPILKLKSCVSLLCVSPPHML